MYLLLNSGKMKSLSRDMKLQSSFMSFRLKSSSSLRYRLRESIGVLLWAVLIILPILSHCRFTCHLKIGLFPFQEFFTFMYILLMKEWTIVSNGFIMYMIWLVFETFEQTQPNKNWKENEK